MKQIVTAALLTLSLAMPVAFAQNVAQQTAPAAQLDPAAVAAAKELLELMKFRDMMQKSFAQMQQNLPQIMLQGATAAINANPKLDAAQKQDAIARVSKELPDAAKAFADTMNDPKLMDELIAETIPLYARHFSAAELRAAVAFYNTPVGVKMVQSMPQLMGESMQISQRVVMPRMMATIEKLTQGKK